eukprot:TRINITY_DN123_c0_g2_i1.p1 TRINITY_DN123_c0_g2~~TRINITY_DN123_c0_g2_i1.p1  ORF type:complete len:118 (-),score=8.03 TRINITY_DN123_c0_g2_i1:23-376(-)
MEKTNRTFVTSFCIYASKLAPCLTTRQRKLKTPAQYSAALMDYSQFQVFAKEMCNLCSYLQCFPNTDLGREIHLSRILHGLVLLQQTNHPTYTFSMRNPVRFPERPLSCGSQPNSGG